MESNNLQRREQERERKGTETRSRRERWSAKRVIKSDATKTSRNSCQIPKYDEESKLKSRAILRVGTGTARKTFHVESAILCNSSAVLRTHFESQINPSDVDLPTKDPMAVEMFIDWAKRPKHPISYLPGKYSSEPWISHAVDAYILGHKIDAMLFEIYALSQFIQNCALIPLGPWKFIEENAPIRSPLARFSNHWVAWNFSLSGPGENEYSGLEATQLATQVQASTRDPRILEPNHWFLSCGDDINSKCKHDPIFVENEQEKKRVKRRPPPPEWGAEYEKAGSKGAVSTSL